MVRNAVALAALAGTSFGASAAFISFASDSNPTEPTFEGTYNAGSGTTTLMNNNPAPLDLLFDPDEDGGGGPITVSADFEAEFELTYVGSLEILPGFWSHTFSFTGFFEFTEDSTNDLLVRGEIVDGQAAFSGLGNATMVFSGSMSGFDIDYEVGSAAPLFGFDSGATGDFSFTMTDINGGSGASLVFDGQDIVGIDDLTAEASFSGSIVPAPGGALLVGMAGIVGLPRRRR